MKYILATDSFKGCLASADVEETIAQVFSAKGMEVVALPMSDGGEGMLETFTTVLKGKMVEVPVHDPLMRPITAFYGIAPDGTAIIETSKACGLTLMREEERNPMLATTYGVGELVAHALRNGCHKFIIGLGGSGTSDAGIGMLKALTDDLTTEKGFDEVLATKLKNSHFTLACDVRNPLFGPTGAAYTFGAQKGATPNMQRVLDNRARRFSRISARHCRHDKSCVAGAGAAGGLGYAFMQYLGASTCSGADLLLDLVDFDRIMADADIVVTGEGSADRQTLMGKLPERILRRAQRQGIPVWLIAGRVTHPSLLMEAGFTKVDCITPDGMPVCEATKPDVARRNLRHWAETIDTVNTDTNK